MPPDALNRDQNRQRRRSRDVDNNKHRPRDGDNDRKARADRAADSGGERPRKKRQSTSKSSSSKALLSVDSLAQLDALNEKRGWKGFDEAYLHEVRAKEGRMERERRQEEKAEREQNRADKREEEREKKKDKKRRLKQLELERQREAQDRQRDVEEMKEAERYTRTREYEAEIIAEDEHTTTSEENRSQEMDEYWARRTRHEQEKEQRPVIPSNADGRLHKKNHRLVSGSLLEEGGNEKRRGRRGDKRLMGGGSGGTRSTYTTDSEWRRKRNKRICICIAIAVVIIILAIAIPLGVLLGKKNDGGSSSGSGSSSNTTKPSNGNLNGISGDSIPAQYKGTYFDPFSWYDTTDFNVTFTDVSVGGLPVMGLNSTWDDSIQANPNVPPLDQSWSYGSRPIRGINVGGWLSIEPFITPSLFQKFSSSANVIDEWGLTATLGSNQAKNTLEQHYSSFVNAQTFSDIRAAGFDHVRIPFSYWAVVTYDGDPYVANVSWRYLLRGIEYCRLNGLRVNLDLHAVPGSQNGWNHSGREGVIGWLNGTDGDLNAQRSIDIHNQLSTFFAQPRYKNIIQLYGLVNEPRMVALDTTKVLNWTTNVISTIRRNNITCLIAFGDGFLGLDNWQGKLQGIDNLVLDVHQYVIFNNQQLAMDHSNKLKFACSGWTAQMQRSENKATGFGPTLCGEWSQADTDCAQYLNGVGAGARWDGTMNMGNPGASVLNPQCPTQNNPPCECNDANADPGSYSAPYKQWLLDFAEAQMESFESSWGWFYWTWDTETSTQWSYKKGLAAGILPPNIANRQFNCNSSIPDFSALGLAENY